MLSLVVVGVLEEVWGVSDDIGHGSIPTRIDLLMLERLHEAPHVRVVIGITRAGHGAQEARLGQSFSVAPGRILRTSVRVVNASRWRIPAVDSGVQRGHGEARIEGGADGVADHLAREHVQDDGEEDEPPV